MIKLATAICALLALTATAFADDFRRIPDLTKTPGEARPLTKEQVCSTKWGKDERLVTQAMKEEVFAAYGITAPQRHLPNDKPAFEIDHSVSRELAGADTVKNLWPQPYTGVWNAHQKDKLENRLHVEVCAGRIELKAAQDAINVDWRKAYVQYYGNPPAN